VGAKSKTVEMKEELEDATTGGDIKSAESQAKPAKKDNEVTSEKRMKAPQNNLNRKNKTPNYSRLVETKTSFLITIQTMRIQHPRSVMPL
jgi:hypothetical protein